MTQQHQASEQPRIAETRPAITAHEGQLSAEQIGRIFTANREFAIQQRKDFLEANPHFIPCSVAGCEGLVGPNYQRVTRDGTAYGFCPRRQAHSRLMPEVFRPR